MILAGGCHTFQRFVSEFSDAFEYLLIATHALGRAELHANEGYC